MMHGQPNIKFPMSLALHINLFHEENLSH